MLVESTEACYRINKNIFDNVDLMNKDLCTDILISQIQNDLPIAIFAYGSLIWNPGFKFDYKIKTTISNMERSFCITGVLYRGTIEQPGLILALRKANGISCEGVSYFLNKNTYSDVIKNLLIREHTGSFYIPIWSIEENENGKFNLLSFVCNDGHDRIFPSNQIDHQFDVIKKASGSMGTNLEYLIETGNALRQNRIVDPYIESLMELAEVA